MPHMFASALVLAGCLLGLFLSRRRPPRIQSGVDVAALAAISLALWNDGENPLLRAAAMLTPDALADPPPVTLLTRLGERTNGYAIIFKVADMLVNA